MTGAVILQKRIVRADLRANPKRLYIFGDNMAGLGLGGQAKEMRGEPNAGGIPTKWRPGMSDEDFFADKDIFNSHVRDAIFDGFERAYRALLDGTDVVFPADGIGTGLAQLPKRAPLIAAIKPPQRLARPNWWR